MDAGFVMDLELECDSSLDEKILFQVAPELGINGEKKLVPDRVRVARAVQRVCVRYENSGLPWGEWRPRSGFQDTPPGVAATFVQPSENFPRRAVRGLDRSPLGRRRRPDLRDGRRRRGGFRRTPRTWGRRSRHAERAVHHSRRARLRPPSLRQVAVAAMVLERGKQARRAARGGRAVPLPRGSSATGTRPWRRASLARRLLRRGRAAVARGPEALAAGRVDACSVACAKRAQTCPCGRPRRRGAAAAAGAGSRRRRRAAALDEVLRAGRAVGPAPLAKPSGLTASLKAMQVTPTGAPCVPLSFGPDYCSGDSSTPLGWPWSRLPSGR